VPTTKTRQPQRSHADSVAFEAAEETLRASLEASQKIAEAVLQAGSEAAVRVRQALKEAVDAIGQPDR
jgi:hypothetical protein